jgi:2-C-methyl-D-erythritol 2,4-cyclodiphosphate synthase
MRIGIGYDIHRLVDGRRLVLGGVMLEHRKGLLGHSDADVLLHAIADALLGSIGAGDIGTHFPDTDKQYKDISSIELIKKVGEILSNGGYSIANIDGIVVAEEPKLAPHLRLIRESISGALGLPVDKISVKATTNEGLGVLGNGEAIAAYAVALIE